MCFFRWPYSVFTCIYLIIHQENASYSGPGPPSKMGLCPLPLDHRLWSVSWATYSVPGSVYHWQDLSVDRVWQCCGVAVCRMFFKRKHVDQRVSFALGDAKLEEWLCLGWQTKGSGLPAYLQRTYLIFNILCALHNLHTGIFSEWEREREERKK